MLAEMGNNAFKLGNVFTSTYNDLKMSPVCKTVCAASILESLPSCADCVYQPYCGTCPVINFAEENNIFSRSAFGYRCSIYKGMLDKIFNILYLDNKDEIEIISSW